MLKREWGTIDIPSETFDRAAAVLEIIRKEESVLSDLRLALASAGVQGSVGLVDASSAALHHLRESLDRIRTTTIRTKLGGALVAFAKVRFVKPERL